jgi:hypothetical protein
LFDPLPGAVRGIVEHVLLGPVMASLLMLRGLLPIHASANRIQGGAIAIVGTSGRGKSSMAAALHVLAGAPIHADDLLGVPLEGRPPIVAFGVGKLKLNVDVVRHLGMDPEHMSTIYEGVDKRAWSVMPAGASEPAPAPLRAIYRVADGDQCEVVPVDPRRAVFELLLNSFRPEVQQHAMGGQRLLEMATAVAGSVPFFLFKRPRSLDRLKEAALLLRDHALTV